MIYEPELIISLERFETTVCHSFGSHEDVIYHLCSYTYCVQANKTSMISSHKASVGMSEQNMQTQCVSCLRNCAVST